MKIVLDTNLRHYLPGVGGNVLILSPAEFLEMYRRTGGKT